MYIGKYNHRIVNSFRFFFFQGVEKRRADHRKIFRAQGEKRPLGLRSPAYIGCDDLWYENIFAYRGRGNHEIQTIFHTQKRTRVKVVNFVYHRHCRRPLFFYLYVRLSRSDY